jgi:hypothetical protein
MLFRNKFITTYSRNLLARQVRAFSGKDVTAPTTMSHDKMKTDARYQPVNEVPESLRDASMSEIIHSPGFSIKGEAKSGRPAYLDFQATTPLDPRVLDAMVSPVNGFDVHICNITFY